MSTVNEVKGCGSPIDDLHDQSDAHTGYRVDRITSGINKSFLNMSTQHGQNIASKDKSLPVNQDNIFSSSNLLGSTDLNFAIQNEECSSSYTAYKLLLRPDLGNQQFLTSCYQPEVTPIIPVSLYSDQIQSSENNSIENLSTVTSSMPSAVNAKEERTIAVNSSKYSHTLQTINSQYKLKLLWGGTDGLISV